VGRTGPVHPLASSTRASLTRQHLSPGTTVGPGGVLSVVDDVVGLHATAPETPYLSLHARVEGPVMDQLDRDLYEDRSLVRLKAMRGTVFVLTRRLATITFAATRQTTTERDRRWLGLDPDTYARWAPAVLETLADRSLTTAQLRRSMQGATGLSSVVAVMCDEGLIVRDRPTGGRKSTTFTYRRWERAYPAVDLDTYEPEEATRLLVREYIGRYGPVSMDDIGWWTGLPARAIHAAVASLSNELTSSRLPGIAGELLALDPDAAGPDQFPGEVLGVRLLPRLDPYTMGYHDRTRLVDAAHHDLIYDRGGNATSVVLIEGRVAGVWDLTDTPEPTARLLLLDPHPDPGHRTEALDRAGVAGRFWFGQDVPVQEYTEMVPNRERAGVMRKPLDGARPR